MEALYTQNLHIGAEFQHPQRLSDIPSSAFAIINDFLNLCSHEAIPFSWVVTVYQQRSNPMNNSWRQNLPGQTAERLDSRGSPVSPTPTSGKRRFDCHKCSKTLGCRKEFLRHLAQKCELKVWNCPDCPKEYRRLDHLREHHKKHGHCAEKDCMHLTDAGYEVHPKIVLGCGYCLHFFEDTQDFCRHLANHFQRDAMKPNWSPTRSIESLLQHPRILPAWKRICEARFGMSEEYWPAMVWTTKGTEGEEVRTLEYSKDGQNLDLCLAKLLENGLVATFVDQLAHSRPPGGYTACPDFTHISPPYHGSDSYWPPSQCIHNDRAQPMFDNDASSFEDPFRSTTSTLINAEGVSMAPNPSRSSPSEVKENFIDTPYEDAPMLSAPEVPFDGDIESMDFISFEPIMDSLSLGPYAGGYGPDDMLIDSPNLKPSPDEAAIMSSIPCSYADNGTHAHNLPSPADLTVAPMKTVYRSPTLHPSLPYETDHLAPPYNATPRLPGRQLHKRSLSGRILRKVIQL